MKLFDSGRFLLEVSEDLLDSGSRLLNFRDESRQFRLTIFDIGQLGSDLDIEDVIFVSQLFARSLKPLFFCAVFGIDSGRFSVTCIRGRKRNTTH